jgi:hypothetical protein
MSYTINHYNGTNLATVADGTVDTSTDLTLIGKNYAGYGQSQNDNFVWLLENFANTTQPPNPLNGQIWYDSSNKKLKFYDGLRFRTAGSSEASSTQPPGLSVGDFWFDTTGGQLNVWNGTGFTLIGPQEVTGAGTTQMVSSNVLDSSGSHHAVIQGVASGNTVFIVSSDTFTLNASNPISGFDLIHQGITLVNTINSDAGVTDNSYRFWGTASNADRLGGHSASEFVLLGNATFNTLVNFGDPGFTVGLPTHKLSISNVSSTFNNNLITPTIANTYNDTIIFQTTAGSTQTPLILKGADVLPGVSGASNLGTSGLQWNNIYAGYVYSTAAQADSLKVGGNWQTAAVASVSNTIVSRDSSANISANLFQGTATAAQYADLAEKYLADAEYEVGTVVMVGGEKEVTACASLNRALGVVSEKPAFMMNKDLVGGTYIALKGRVPVKVWGKCNKGDPMVAFKNGTASVSATDDPDWTVFAIALEDSDDDGIKFVECVIL